MNRHEPRGNGRTIKYQRVQSLKVKYTSDGKQGGLRLNDDAVFSNRSSRINAQPVLRRLAGRSKRLTAMDVLVLVFETRTPNTNHDPVRPESETFLHSQRSEFFNPLLEGSAVFGRGRTLRPRGRPRSEEKRSLSG